MKALVVTPYYYPKIGGLENYARNLGLALAETSKWDIVVATSNHQGRGDSADNVDGMKVYRLGTWFKFSNTPVNPLWPLKLRQIIRRERPDIILAHTPVPTMADAAAIVRGQTPLVLFYHASTLKKGGSRLFNIVASVYQIYESLTLARATRIAAVSEYVRDQLPRRCRAKTVTVPNAVRAESIVPRTQPDGSTPHFIFIGSLDKTHTWKGLDLIIKAASEYTSAYKMPAGLTVVGDGNNRAVYERLARDVGAAQQIHFTGALTGAAKDQALAKATALICYPTTANDAFPTVMLEAWAAGVPVVAAAIGPIPGLIHDNQDGWLIHPHDPKMLAEKMRFIAGLTPAERQRIAKNAAARTVRDYTWQKQAAVVSQLAEELR